MGSFKEAKDLKQMVRPLVVIVGAVVLFGVAGLVLKRYFPPATPVPKVEDQTRKTSEDRGTPSGERKGTVQEQPTSSQEVSKGKTPAEGSLRGGPSYAAPSYTIPGAKAPMGQMQKLEPSLPGTTEGASPLGNVLQGKKGDEATQPTSPTGEGKTREREGEGVPLLPGAKTGVSVSLPHEAEHEEAVKPPELSPIPGVTFVETMINLMEHELKGRFLGWRPNDLIVGRFTDNINNYQLGVLEAMRFTTLRLKDSLTRMGEADAYDRDLQDALNLFMNKATQFWFPSAETSYSEAVDHLKRFLDKLKRGERKFYYRIDNLISLIISYNDLLGNVNRTLIMEKRMDGKPVSWFETDDYFYYAKGVAHVMFEVLKVVRVGFREQLATINAVEIMDEILHELSRTERMDPWIILDSDLDGFFANHRANLNAPLSEVVHLMTVMSRF